MTISKLARTIRATLVAATPLLALPWHGSSRAQEAGEDAEAERLDRIEVTGSRIKRADVETSQPIFELDREDILAQGLTSIGDVIQNLTSHGSAQNSNVNNGGNGESQVDLRNLGPGRTLVLVNGRRWVGGTGLGGAVDLNSIPTAAVDRIEVLKDGASVIYGSDAIAGVVNIILRDEFQGAEANAYYGQYGKGDGARQAYDFTVGTSGERYSAMLGLGYVEEEPVFAGDREISREPILGTGNAFGSSVTPFGSFLLCDGAIDMGQCSGDLVDPGGTPFAPFTYDPGRSGLDWRSVAFPDDLYNYAPENYLRTPQERLSVFTSGRLDISDHVRFKATMTYNNRKSEQLLASTPVLLGAATGSPLGRSIYIHEDSFYNPFDRPVGFISRRAVETGGRSFNQDVDTLVLHGAFEGDFQLGDRLFEWELGYFRGENKRNDSTFGQFSLPALRDALGPSFQDGPNGPIVCGTPDDPATPENERTVIEGCVPANLLGAAGTLTPEMLDYVGVIAHDKYGYEQTTVYGNLTGELFDVPAGPVAFAAGLEHRDEFGFDEPDALINSSSTTGNPRVGTRGGYDLDEAFVELSVPLLADVPLARQLDINVATRTSDYSNFGDTLNSKIGVRWKPVEDLIVRGNYSEGFRAPSVAELFAGTTEFFYDNLIDPCDEVNYPGLSPAAQARCQAQGAPDGGFPQLPGAITRTLVGGNVNLEPEPSTTKTLGFVYSPEWANGLNFAVDWWRIEFENTITDFPVDDIISLCIVDGIESFCDLFTRTPEGIIDNLDARALNIGSTLAEGYDLTVSYDLPETRWGRFGVVWDTAYLARNESDIDGDGIRGENQLELPEIGAPLFNNESGNRVGTYSQGDNNWRIRSNLMTRWEMGAFGAVWMVRYYSHQDEDCQLMVEYGFDTLCSDPDRRIGIPTDLNGNSTWDGEGIDAVVSTPAAQNRLGSTTYHDLNAYWNAPWGSRITVGVNNVFDRTPPRSVQAFANSFDPQYQVPGRFYYVRISHRF